MMVRPRSCAVQFLENEICASANFNSSFSTLLIIYHSDQHFDCSTGEINKLASTTCSSLSRLSGSDQQGIQFFIELKFEQLEGYNSIFITNIP
ncbi:MAG: hypothetical protein AAGI23_18760 [Bacteroidota bacterium]